MTMINFIPDEDISLDNGKDLLGTKSYVDTLLEIIQGGTLNKYSFTIGLFGGWGSGKSSIIKTLQERLKDCDILFLESYNAWKYSGDSFRRAFLIQLNNHLSEKERIELDSFYTTTIKDTSTKKINRIAGILYILGFIVITILLYRLFTNFDGNTKIGALFQSLGLTSFLGSIGVASFALKDFAGWIFDTIKDQKIEFRFMKQEKGQQLSDPVTCPEKFEDIFKSIIEKLLKDKKKIIIVIDNIDRCDQKTAFELLLTVKNFLGHENVIFIIPIDDNELKRHVSGQGYDGNEFLRKIFNISLTIKKLSEEDLFDYTNKLNTDYKLGLNNDVIELISWEFSKNPRKIIQFLNILQIELLLAQKLEDYEKIKGIKENIPFLTKNLIIREEWGYLYQQIMKDPILLDEINRIVSEYSNYEDYSNRDKKCNKKIGLNKDQFYFFYRTRLLEHPQPEIFFLNHNFSDGLPLDLFSSILNGDVGKIKSYIGSRRLTFIKFINFIEKKIEQMIRRDSLNIHGINFFSFILDLSEDKDLSMEFDLYYKQTSKSCLKSFLNNNTIINLLNSGKFQSDRKRILRFAKEYNNETIYKFVLGNIESQSVSKYNKNLLIDLLDIFGDQQEKLNDIIGPIQDVLILDLNSYNEFQKLIEEKGVTEYVFDKSFIMSLISTLDSWNNSWKDSLFKIIISYKQRNVLDVDLESVIQSKIITSFLSIENVDVDRDLFGINFLNEFISNNFLESSLSSSILRRFDFISNNFDSYIDTEEHIHGIQNYCNLLYHLYVFTNLDNADIIWKLNTLFEKGNQGVSSNINYLYQKIITDNPISNWSFADIIINRCLSYDRSPEILDTINLMINHSDGEKGITKQSLNRLLTYLFNNDVDALKKLNYTNKMVKDCLSDIVIPLSIQDKEKNLLTIKELGIDGYNQVICSIIDSTPLLSLYNEIVVKYGIDLGNPEIKDCIVDKIKPVLADVNIGKDNIIAALNIILKMKSFGGRKKTIAELLKDINILNSTPEDTNLLTEARKHILKDR